MKSAMRTACAAAILLSCAAWMAGAEPLQRSRIVRLKYLPPEDSTGTDGTLALTTTVFFGADILGYSEFTIQSPAEAFALPPSVSERAMWLEVWVTNVPVSSFDVNNPPPETRRIQAYFTQLFGQTHVSTQSYGDVLFEAIQWPTLSVIGVVRMEGTAYRRILFTGEDTLN